MTFSRNIGAYIQRELREAKRLEAAGDAAQAFRHLENAHVLGQRSTRWHTLAHYRMFVWAIRQRDVKETFGQLVRMAGAVTKTVLGLVPEGNTGGSNVSPFKRMAIAPELADILASSAKPQ